MATLAETLRRNKQRADEHAFQRQISIDETKRTAAWIFKTVNELPWQQKAIFLGVALSLVVGGVGYIQHNNIGGARDNFDAWGKTFGLTGGLEPCQPGYPILPVTEPGQKCVLPDGTVVVNRPQIIPEAGDMSTPISTEKPTNAATVTSTLTPTPTHTETPTPPATATAEPTKTPEPTATPQPTKTSTPRPTVPPQPTADTRPTLAPTPKPTNESQNTLPADWPAWIRQYPEYGWTKIDDNGGGHWKTNLLPNDPCPDLAKQWKKTEFVPYDPVRWPTITSWGEKRTMCIGGVNGPTLTTEFTYGSPK